MGTIGIITARGGSKRIPRKNIRLFLGQPIIKYAIDAALASGLFEEVMVSTDDPEIAEIARQLGAAVPFMRSPETSTDFSTTNDVILEVLNAYELHGKTYNYACCIYPTAAFITPEKLRRAFDIIVHQGANCVMPIAAYSVPIWWALKKNEQNIITLHWPENAVKRSQDLPRAYYDCGQFYFFRTQSFVKHQTLFTEKTIGLEVPETEVQDIDNEADWKIAELKYELFKKSGP